MRGQLSESEWQRHRRVLAGVELPAGYVDLDAFEANVRHFAALGKPLRIATKSLRVPALVGRAAALLGTQAVGLMTYCAAETAFYAGDEGRVLAGAVGGDLLLAYPTLQAADLAALVEAARRAEVRVIVDARAQVEALGRAAAAGGVTLGAVIDVDMSWRPFSGVHVGVRRSPLYAVDDVVALARVIAATPGLRGDGFMGYEAQIAGLTDAGELAAWQNPIKRALKRRSRADVERKRAALVAALTAAGVPPRLANGGGTGSAAWAARENALSEITVGSGFFAGHLFDDYAGLELAPALFFALQVVRHPAPGMVTCHGGGWPASGAAGPDRLPRPVGPPGTQLLPLEGTGEVQTPLAVTAPLALGEPVVFRPAKSGELAEHLTEYLLIRGDKIEGRAATYRGLGKRFLG